MPRPKLFGAISRKKLRANRFASQKSQIQSNTIKERLEGYDDQPGCSTSSYDNNFETSNDTNNEEIKPFQVSGRRVIEIHSASQKSHKITRAAAARRKNGKVVCPECNTDVDVEGRQGDKATAMLVNVYQYFATEGTKLSPSQLRERTALCTGASEEDVEHALGLYWSQTGDSDSQEAPSRKRRRVEEQPGDESHPLYVEVEVEAAEDEENGEEDPLTSEEEDIKPDITETCIQPVSQSSYIPVEDIKKETTEFEDGVS
ncbi:uncharacterized protein LOC118278959 isoform X8 [Spodoptera frugiperda]|uniref:Uncharacterized protein LOC118278959 isoform X8 n=1 Tax=Spodoptera frugiperda TaxID=7108 RepID=A0A9R0F476_SPOFR|nr:uncharacterized protein LOC118278959 isoform X8 [Spodoptera frugiperda]